jgi:hypothetical protein
MEEMVPKIDPIHFYQIHSLNKIKTLCTPNISYVHGVRGRVV